MTEKEKFQNYLSNQGLEQNRRFQEDFRKIVDRLPENLETKTVLTKSCPACLLVWTFVPGFKVKLKRENYKAQYLIWRYIICDGKVLAYYGLVDEPVSNNLLQDNEVNYDVVYWFNAPMAVTDVIDRIEWVEESK